MLIEAPAPAANLCSRVLKKITLPVAASLIGGALLYSTPLWVPKAVTQVAAYQQKKEAEEYRMFWARARTPAEIFKIISDRHIKGITNQRHAEVIPGEVFQIGTAEAWGEVFYSEATVYMRFEKKQDGRALTTFQINDAVYVLRSLRILTLVSDQLIQSNQWQAIQLRKGQKFIALLRQLRGAPIYIGGLYNSLNTQERKSMKPADLEFLRQMAEEQRLGANTQFAKFEDLAQVVLKLRVAPN